ncbi:MAG: hypothetical protein EA361_13515 [Bacteroidetes bacterium]|nr:MAG: hypothetical protein EA361_13515 [Bacteroidota bacterium]
MKKATGLLVFLIIYIPSLMAQFSISADISPRAELRHGYRVLPQEGEKAAILVSQRTRLNLAWKSENLRTHISFQDVRVWGQEGQRQVHPSLAIHEAWAELLFTDSLTLKIGRQHLRYDNQRFFAINDWIPMGQKHDVALLKYISEAGELHFGTAFNQPPEAFQRNFTTDYGINNYKYMNYIWFNTDINPDANLSLMGVADGHEFNDGAQYNPELMYVRGTWSAFLKYDAGTVNLMVNPAFQHGRHRTGQSISAWYLRAEAAAPTLENVTTTAGFEIFSGNDATDAADDKYRAFDALYGAGHAHLGFMDYFTLIPQHTRNAGLINPFLKNRFILSDNTFMDADLHLFFIQNNFVYQEETISKYLGTEIDLTLNYRFNNFTRIIGGFSWMFGSESMEIINRGATRGSKEEPAYFAYIMLRIRPKFL